MSNKALTFIAEYFRKFAYQQSIVRLTIATLLVIVAFKLIAPCVHPCNKIQMLFFLMSGIIPFLLVTIIKKYRFSLPLSLFAILLIYFWLGYINQHSL